MYLAVLKPEALELKDCNAVKVNEKASAMLRALLVWLKHVKKKKKKDSPRLYNESSTYSMKQHGDCDGPDPQDQMRSVEG